MATIPLTYTSAAGGTSTVGVPSLTCALPTNVTGQVMIAVLNVSAVADPVATRPVLTTPSGWTLLDDNDIFGTLAVRRATLRKLGDGTSGSVIFAFDQNVRGEVFIITIDEVNTTTPVDAHNFTNNTSTTHTVTANAITSTVANALILGFFCDDQSGLFFTSSNSLSNVLINQGGISFGSERPLLVAYDIQPVAGSTGAKTATTNATTFSPQAFLVAIRPAPNPSIPVLTYPNGGEALTAGAVVNITWNPSTSPTATQASLKYNLDYSSNNGVSWTSIVSLTSVGVTTYAWTVPATIGNGYLVRIRSNDPALSLFSLGYDQSDAVFSVIAETTPGQPVITAPTSGSVNNKAVNVAVSWLHQGGLGNPQVAFTLQWANNVAFTSPTTVGPTTTTTQSTSIDFSVQASGTTIYVKVKTQGVSLYSAYSNIVSFIVASLPATPNITAPTNASPPTTPLPSVTFTEADPFVARKFRVTLSGSEVFNSGEVASTALSFTSPYSFANGIAVAIFLSVKSSLGLWSAEDTETVTPAYSGPAPPSLTAQAVDSGGYVLCQFTNSDTPIYNELWRYLSTANISTAIRVATLLPKNASYSDYHVISGLNYKYFARAYNSLLFTDGSATSPVGIVLPNLFIHAISRTGTSSNVAGQAVSLLNTEGQWAPMEIGTRVKLLGRAAPGLILGQAIWERLTATTVVTQYSQVNSLLALWRLQKTGSVICVRDQKGNRLFGKMSQPTVQDQSTHLIVQFDLETSRYVEAV